MDIWRCTNTFVRLVYQSCMRAGPRVRAEYYYQPAGFAGRVFLLRALGRQQARSRPAQYLIVLSL